jgi:acetyl-CoA synthetase
MRPDKGVLVVDGQIEAYLSETRSFAPPPSLARSANATAALYAEANRDPLAWWRRQADRLVWDVAPSTTLEWALPFARWFPDGRLNAAVNCVDRHVSEGHGDRVAFHWVGEPEGDALDITYGDLLERVCRAANGLAALGLKAGDRVAIYMPMVPEAIVAMLACARLGAAHSVIFGGFAAEALIERILDADCRYVITADGGFRRGSASALKVNVDAALERCPEVSTVVVVRRTRQPVEWVEGRDHWWHDVIDGQSPVHEPESFPAEQPLYLMYTSGTTARPKGILHTTGGYLTHVATTHHYVFDHKAGEDVCWTSADIGWVTGHSYIVYGPLCNGATQVLYEGTPDAGGRDRWWRIVDRYRVSVLYTAPTAIRTFMKWGPELPAAHDLSSLRLLGSVGEPINPEAWIWYHEHIGRGNCPIVDTWWQTETGGIMATPLPGVTSTKPGAAMTPFPGISIDVVDNEGESVGRTGGGFLTITEPWPGMTRGIWGDAERFTATYWERFPGSYFAGDGAKRDEDGDLWLLGRVDDVMNVSGHRLSTAEVEHSLVGHDGVAEAAVVGASDETTGQAIVAFVTLTSSMDEMGDHHQIIAALRDHVGSSLSPIAKPRQIIITPDLPKTRSGKIMRRLLRDVAEHRALGDVTTLTDPTVVDVIDGLMAAHADDDE